MAGDPDEGPLSPSKSCKLAIGLAKGAVHTNEGDTSQLDNQRAPKVCEEANELQPGLRRVYPVLGVPF